MNYRLKIIDEIESAYSIYKLCIKDKCPFDEFCEKIEKEGNYLSELDTIYA